MTGFESYIAPARTWPGLWRVLVGLAIVGGFWIHSTVAVLFGWAAIDIMMYGDVDAALARLESMGDGGAAYIIAIMLSTFVGVWQGMAVALAALHGQPFHTIFGPVRRIGWREFGIGLALAACFALPSTLAAAMIAEPVRSSLPLETWALWILPIFLLIFVQATGEELIFRGYLLQQLARRSANPLVWAALPSVLFGLMHYSGALPDDVTFYYVLVTAVMGITMAALVWRTGGLWMAAGLHVGVNTISLSVIGADGLMSGTQLWLFPDGHLAEMMQLDLIAVILMLGFVVSPLGRVLGTAGRDPAAAATGEA